MKIRALVLAMVATTALSACKEEAPKVANITMVESVTKTVKTPYQECLNVVVTKKAAPTDENRILGTVGGAAAGAALGNQIGGGSGKVIATAAGTIAGALAGREIQGNIQDNNVVSTTEKQCHTEYKTSTTVIGYDVTYEIKGVPTTVRLDKKPAGKTFPIQDGKVVLPE
ncbi:glycine zipper 2TM domain-containing protein [Vibrio hepatarius]|jgi:uncharacterized protein YcfJ|nr:glycine zipper 2TM domain-containing protein [Vibrio hepatarius]NOI13582.1 glycine zipper 2TM domain-containing protein [Vibrio hepatarius]